MLIVNAMQLLTPWHNSGEKFSFSAFSLTFHVQWGGIRPICYCLLQMVIAKICANNSRWALSLSFPYPGP